MDDITNKNELDNMYLLRDELYNIVVNSNKYLELYVGNRDFSAAVERLCFGIDSANIVEILYDVCKGGNKSGL